ncbi:MAG: trypsin-like peptidase domain-containing protein [Sulfuritalea sp.]|nr:trypsin-like peptidase domain-containing protein [Sulfuritalea sp.]
MEINSIAKRLLFSTVRVDTVLEDGSQGTGTAFVFDCMHNGKPHSFVVTNRHLAENVRTGALIFTRKRDGQPMVGRGFRLDIEDFSQAWFYHPDASVDLAVLPLRPLEAHIREQGGEIFYQAIDGRLIPDGATVTNLDALEQVIFVGYPSGVWDKANLMPILRRGTTATPVFLDFEARPEFLVDAAVYPGSSGSPVFLYDSDTIAQRGAARRFLFLGVVAAVFFKEESNHLVSAPIPASQQTAVYSSEMIDLGLVIKSSQVRAAAEAYLREAGL